VSGFFFPRHYPAEAIRKIRNPELLRNVWRRQPVARFFAVGVTSRRSAPWRWPAV